MNPEQEEPTYCFGWEQPQLPREHIRDWNTRPTFQAPAEPAKDRLARIIACQAEPGLTPMRRAMLDARAEQLTVEAQLEAEYDQPEPTAEELAHVGQQAGVAYHD